MLLPIQSELNSIELEYINQSTNTLKIVEIQMYYEDLTVTLEGTPSDIKDFITKFNPWVKGSPCFEE